MKRALCLLFALVAGGCSTPSPVAPGLHGSIGLPHSGFLTDSVELPKEGKGFKWKSTADHHWGLPRMVAMIEDAAGQVDAARPSSQPLFVGDISAKGGGQLMPKHRSHRTGRDVDLLFFLTTIEGIPIPNPAFVNIGADGLGVSETGHFVRFDVDREWLLIRGIVSSKDAHVQWIFISRVLEALLVERAIARGEPPELIHRAQTVMQQPGDSLPHDDHIHVRLACEPEERAHGCEGGPTWEWLPRAPKHIEASRSELLDALLGPSVSGGSAIVTTPVATAE
jgi:penicillin-insensitive murein endopeptidase